MDIIVKVNGDGQPVLNDHSQGKGKVRIYWRLRTEGYRFESLTCLPDPPFSVPTLSPDKQTIWVVNNNHGTKTINYEYVITIERDVITIAPDNLSPDVDLQTSAKAVIRNVP